MKNLYLIILTAVFISCSTTEVKYGGMFTGGQNSYDLQQGSIEYASIIKNVVLGYADGNFEEIIEHFSDSVTRIEPGNRFESLLALKDGKALEKILTQSIEI